MFSDEFMKYLINYQPDGSEVEIKKDEPKVINFKTSKLNRPAEVYVYIKR